MSFRFRITFFMTALISVLFSVGGSVMIHQTFQKSIEKEEQMAVDNSRMVLKMLLMVEQDKEWFDEEDLIGTISDISIQDAVKLTDGKEVVYKRGSEAVEFEDWNDKVTDEKVVVSYFCSSKGEPFVQTTAKIILEEKSYYFMIGRNLQHIYSLREGQIHAFQVTFIALLLVGSIFAWITATFLTAPLRKLQYASREIASGNLSFRSEIHTEDEIGSLSADFDAMAMELEDNIKKLREAAEQKEQFMGAFTHELKTPMTSIIGYADLLRTQQLSKEEEEDAINYIFSEAKRLENMSLKMLDLFVADKNEIVLEEAVPAKIVNYVADHLRQNFEKNGILICAKTEDGKCRMDSDLVQALLINLLDNARKSMKQGGKIEICLKMLPDGCEISVKDEGKGIPKEALNHLTEAFYRVDKSRSREEGSAGLGLSLCDKIVKLHRGTMEFESEEGKGTMVKVTLRGGRQK